MSGPTSARPVPTEGRPTADVLRALVVDDEPGIRAGAARVLARGTFRIDAPDDRTVRFEVDEADSGEAALAVIAARPPDLLVLDHKLPGISGLEVLARCAVIAPETVAIMITAYATLETAVVATKRGAFDFLAKPFTPDELRAAAVRAARQVMLRRQARAHAEEKRRIRFEFVSVLAHELKAPIAAIEGYLATMEEKALGPAIDAYGPPIARSLTRLRGMRKLIDDLLDLTRIESGQRRRELVRVDLAAAALAAAETFRSEAAAARVTLEPPAGGPVVLSADRMEVDLVLSNLVSNAIKYNRPGGRVALEVARRDGRAVLRVRDTGIGMTQEEAEGLFHDFARVKNEQTRLIPGSGLGLSIVRKIARLYGGDAEVVETAPGAGTTLEVVLGPCEAGVAGQA